MDRDELSVGPDVRYVVLSIDDDFNGIVVGVKG